MHVKDDSCIKIKLVFIKVMGNHIFAKFEIPKTCSIFEILVPKPMLCTNVILSLSHKILYAIGERIFRCFASYDRQSLFSFFHLIAGRKEGRSATHHPIHPLYNCHPPPTTHHPPPLSSCGH